MKASTQPILCCLLSPEPQPLGMVSPTSMVCPPASFEPLWKYRSEVCLLGDSNPVKLNCQLCGLCSSPGRALLRTLTSPFVVLLLIWKCSLYI